MVKRQIIRHRAIFRYHPEWGYWYRPNLFVRSLGNTTDAAPYVIETNSYGARTRHDLDGVADQPSPQARRIMFVGCSFAAGDGVANEKRFSDLIEGRSGWECHNYALNGTGHDQQALIHDTVTARLSPDILVFCPYSGCVGRNARSERQTYDPLLGRAVMRAKPYFQLDGDDLTLHNQPVPKTMSLVDNSSASFGERAKKAFVRLVSTPQRRSLKKQGTQAGVYRNPNQYQARLAGAIIEKIRSDSQAERKILMPLPSMRDHQAGLGAAYRDFFADMAHDMDWEFVDVMPDMLKHDAESLYFKGEGHFTERGHACVAEVLERSLAGAKGGGS